MNMNKYHTFNMLRGYVNIVYVYVTYDGDMANTIGICGLQNLWLQPP